MTDLLLRTTHCDDRIHVTAIGALDHGTAQDFRDKMRRLLDTADKPMVVVGLSCCTNVDVHGLLALVGARHAVQVMGGDLHLAAVPPLIERLIRAESMEDQLPTRTSSLQGRT
jgi:anti-anti-sigma factor